MNEVFLIGKVVTKVEFKFIIYSKNISTAKFDIQILKDNQIIKIRAYNENADLVYSKLNINSKVLINGYINGKGEIILKKLLHWQWKFCINFPYTKIFLKVLKNYKCCDTIFEVL